MNKHDLEALQQLNSAEISDVLDALNIESVLLGIKSLSIGHKLIGPAYTIKYKPYETQPRDCQNAGNYIDKVSPGAVIVIDNEGNEACTTWGEILTQVALSKGIKGTVIHGACRDVDAIRELNYPVFTRAITMRSGKNRVYKAFEQIDINIGETTVKPGDIIFADDCGVLVIPQGQLQVVIEKAQNIQRTEALIIKSVRLGMRLEEARKVHRYDMPWLTHAEKKNVKTFS